MHPSHGLVRASKLPSARISVLPYDVSTTTVQMENHPKLYIFTAFVAGIVLTLGFKDLYPDLERRFRRRRGVSDPLDSRPVSTILPENIKFEDHTKRQSIA